MRSTSVPGVARGYRAEDALSRPRQFMGKLEILIESAGRKERRAFDLAPNAVLTIGRSQTCTIPIDSALISRQHLSIRVNGPAMSVEDSSTNGSLAGSVFLHNSAADVPFGVPIVV